MPAISEYSAHLLFPRYFPSWYYEYMSEYSTIKASYDYYAGYGSDRFTNLSREHKSVVLATAIYLEGFVTVAGSRRNTGNVDTLADLIEVATKVSYGDFSVALSAIRNAPITSANDIIYELFSERAARVYFDEYHFYTRPARGTRS